MDNRFYWETRPLASEKNIVSGKKYRFTVLTPNLIRMEYSENGIFEDRASQTVFFRDFPEVKFETLKRDQELIIETESLILTYVIDSAFRLDTLNVKLKCEPGSQWHFSEPFETLGGTVKTLDGVNGEIKLNDGVCSRNGFSVIDDSKSLLLDDENLVAVRRKNSYDGYFFGYGFDYLTAVKDLYRLTGAPGMLPKYALGNWWSRYYPYTQEEYLALMDRFAAENIPFSVAVIDMDWHIRDIPKELRDPEAHLLGTKEDWTGYTWNEKLFPDYKTFLKGLHDRNLHTSLNLHPAQGVRRHEAMYEKAALADGIDTSEGKRVLFNVLSKSAMENYFDILLHPYEENGVDFWWMDWQEPKNYWWMHEPNRNGIMKDDREVLDPLWMLNHLHVADIRRNGKRPMYFSRFADVGSHRYSLGFSGDVFITWPSLDFQPYFTATASNIGYCWWSHDIGGHFYGYGDSELATRWLQLGTFSPINRMHSEGNPFISKEPWHHAEEYENVMKKYLNLRYKLLPYIYTMNYRVNSGLEPMIQPMYYTHPKCSAAYEVKNQFWFGSELMVAPITEPKDPVDNLAKTTVWLPEGKWFDFFTGTRYESSRGRKLDVFRSLDDYPVFAKSGAIIPMMQINGNNIENPENMEVAVFPGADNEFVLYEDEGEFDNYKNGAFVTTKMEQKFTSSNSIFTISPAEGDTSLIPSKRTWKISFRGFSENMQIKVLADDIEVSHETKVNQANHTTEIIVSIDVDKKITINLEAENLFADNSRYLERCFEILKQSKINNPTKQRVYKLLQDNSNDLHTFMYHIYQEISEYYHLSSALKEQITLTRG